MPWQTPSQSSFLKFIFFFKYTATTEIYPLSLHDALPISTPSSSARTSRYECSGTSRLMATHHAAIVGTGSYVPERVVTNAELSERLGEDIDEFVSGTLGIRERRWCEP